MVTLIATPDTGAEFAGWAGGWLHRHLDLHGHAERGDHGHRDVQHRRPTR
jgi:hypothetical protein